MKSSAARTRKRLEAVARRKPGRLVDLVLDLQRRLKDLEARSTQNSANSHRHPASDGCSKPAPKSLRKRSRRNSGGQNGHRGAALQPVAEPDRVVVHRLKRCPCGCGADLRKRPLLRHEKRQVFDLPPQKLLVDEHRAEVKLCPNSGREVAADFPEGVNAPVQYGPRFNAWLAYLRGQQLIPLERISRMCADLFGRAVSEATIQAAFTVAYHALAGFEAGVKDLIARAAVAHADETGLRIMGKLHRLHVVSTRALTWYGVHRRRGRAAIEHFALLTRFTGRLVHDCLSGYFDFKCLHALCNAHLLRELVCLDEVLRQKWAEPMFDLLLRMRRAVEAHKARDAPWPLRQQAAWQAKFRALVRRGLAENPMPKRPPGPRPRGRPKHTKAQNLLLRLSQHESSVLAFLHDPRVPFSNKQAEQDLRMMKVQQKISGAFLTLEGAQMFARVRSYLSTVRKTHRDVFEDLVAAMSGHPFIPATATCRPVGPE